jgi:hypothetical protein
VSNAGENPRRSRCSRPPGRQQADAGGLLEAAAVALCQERTGDDCPAAAAALCQERTGDDCPVVAAAALCQERTGDDRPVAAAVSCGRGTTIVAIRPISATEYECLPSLARTRLAVHLCQKDLFFTAANGGGVE